MEEYEKVGYFRRRGRNIIKVIVETTLIIYEKIYKKLSNKMVLSAGHNEKSFLLWRMRRRKRG